MISIFTLISLVFFVFGLIVGSFLNVVIYRFNTAKSFGGRSACVSCQNKLCWYELIPLISFLSQKGRCRNCKARISIQYPLVEFATGIVFAALFCKLSALSGSAFLEQDISFLLNLNFFFTYAYYATMFSLLVIIAAYDFRHKIIPDALSFVFGALAFVGLFFFQAGEGQVLGSIFYPHIPTGLEFLSGVFISLPFALLWLLSRGAWMGLGDAKLALGLGWFLGLSLAFSAVVVAFWTGAIVGLCLIAFSKMRSARGNYGMKSEIPFALYLAFGAFLAFIFEFTFLTLVFRLR